MLCYKCIHIRKNYIKLKTTLFNIAACKLVEKGIEHLKLKIYLKYLQLLFQHNNKV